MDGRINSPYSPYSAVSIYKGVQDTQESEGTLGFAKKVEEHQPGIAFNLYASVADVSVFAQYKCGYMLMNGIGVAQDVPLARVYLGIAATNGSVPAKEELAKYPDVNSAPAPLSFSLSNATTASSTQPVCYTFIQAKDESEYKEVKKILEGERSFLKEPEKFKQIFIYEDKELRVYLTKTQRELTKLSHTHACPIVDHHFHGWFSEKDYREIELQLTEACQEKFPDECRSFNHNLERRHQEKEAGEIEEKRSALNFKNVTIDKPDFNQYQIIVVQDNHDTVDAQKWITDYFEKKGKKSNTWLLVEFGQKSESDLVKIKECVTWALNFASFKPKEVNPVTRTMLEKAFEYGFLRGCENTASTEINRLMAYHGPREDLQEQRKKFFDASCAQEINKILQQDPAAEIIVWAGSAHAEGITKNMLSLEGRNLKNITVYPGSDEPASITELVTATGC